MSDRLPKGTGDLLLWIAMGVGLGLLPVWLQLFLLSVGKASVSFDSVLLSGVLAIPSVTIVAGALSQLAIRQGIHRPDMWLLILALVVVIFGTALYIAYSVDTLSLSDPRRLAGKNLGELELGYGLTFGGAVLGGLGCVYRSVTGGQVSDGSGVDSTK